MKSRKELEHLTAYIPGKPIDDVKREYGLDRVVKLASNENPFGTSEKVKEALHEAVDQNLNLYPDGNATLLKEALADFYDLSPENFLLSSGADEMLDLIAKTYLNPGDEVLLSEWSFVRYRDVSQIMGANIRTLPMEDFHFDLDAFRDAMSEKTKIIWLCNPNNPTGTLLPQEEILSFLKEVPSETLVVYDEAYREFADPEQVVEDSHKLFENFPNVLDVRTFSKIYGLAGLRVGYAIGDPDILGQINLVRGPFNVNSLAQVAARVALEDQEFLQKVYENNLEQKKVFYDYFERRGLSYHPSETNHILFRTPLPSQEFFEKMQAKGVIIRPMRDGYIRVSIGLPEENEAFFQACDEVLE